MARFARVVAPGHPQHIIQKGNRRQQTFFCNDDYQAYIDLMSEWYNRCGVEIWCYCLMPNHIHLIAVHFIDLLELETGRSLKKKTGPKTPQGNN